MESSEPTDQSFIIRIWLEETDIESGEIRWRGKITHVPSGKEHYFEDLDNAFGIMSVYMQGMGIETIT